MDNQPNEKQFRAMNKADFDNMDPSTKNAVVRARHMGIMRNCEELIKNSLTMALTQPRQIGEDVLPPPTHEDLLVLLIHRDDPILAEFGNTRDNWEQQNIEVGMFVCSRMEFAQKIAAWVPNGQAGDGNRPYRKTGRILGQPPPPLCVYVAVFDMGMCTVTFIGFDPNNPNGETVPADPNVAPPPAVEPLERIEPKAALESQTG